MTQLFESWKAIGRFQALNVDVNLRSSCDSVLQHGCGFAQPATRNILENEGQTAVSDVEHVQRLLSMLQTYRKQTKQGIITRRDEVIACYRGFVG